MQQFLAILRKETRVILRGQRSFWFLMITLVVAGLLFLARWSGRSGLELTLADGAAFARNLFTGFALIQLGAAGIISALITSNGITAERENRTLELLYCTGLTLTDLIVGKWLASIAFLVLVVVALLPIETLVFTLGGVGSDEFLLATAIVATTTCTYGMLGLYISSSVERSVQAMTLTLLVIVALNVTGIGQLFGAIVRPFASVFSPAFGVGVAAAFDPFAALDTLLRTGSLQAGGSPLLIMAGLAAGNAGLTFLLAALTHSRLARQELRRRVVNQKPIDNPHLLRMRRETFPYYLIDPLRRPQDIRDDQNPVFVKEERIGTYGTPSTIFRIAYLSVIASLLFMTIMTNLAFRNETLMYPRLALVCLSIIFLFMPALGATAISREYQEQTRELLLVTPLKAWEIVHGKLLGLLRLIALVFIATMFMPTVFAFLTNLAEPIKLAEIFAPVVAVIMGVGSYGMFYAGLVLYQSSRCRNNLTALVTVYLTILILNCAMLLTPILSGLAGMDLGGPLSRMPYGVVVLAELNQIIIPMISPFRYFTNKNDMMSYANPIAVFFHTCTTLSAAAGLLLLTARNLRDHEGRRTEAP